MEERPIDRGIDELVDEERPLVVDGIDARTAGPPDQDDRTERGV